MKTLKWFWVVALLAIGFKLYGLLSTGPTGSNPEQMESFVGMVLTFGVLTVALVIFWTIGIARKKVAEKMANRNSSNREKNFPSNA